MSIEHTAHHDSYQKGVQWALDQQDKWHKSTKEKIAHLEGVFQDHMQWFRDHTTARALVSSRRNLVEPSIIPPQPLENITAPETTVSNSETSKIQTRKRISSTRNGSNEIDTQSMNGERSQIANKRRRIDVAKGNKFVPVSENTQYRPALSQGVDTQLPLLKGKKVNTSESENQASIKIDKNNTGGATDQNEIDITYQSITTAGNTNQNKEMKTREPINIVKKALPPSLVKKQEPHSSDKQFETLTRYNLRFRAKNSSTTAGDEEEGDTEYTDQNNNNELNKPGEATVRPTNEIPESETESNHIKRARRCLEESNKTSSTVSQPQKSWQLVIPPVQVEKLENGMASSITRDRPEENDKKDYHDDDDDDEVQLVSAHGRHTQPSSGMDYSDNGSFYGGTSFLSRLLHLGRRPPVDMLSSLQKKSPELTAGSSEQTERNFDMENQSVSKDQSTNSPIELDATQVLGETAHGRKKNIDSGLEESIQHLKAVETAETGVKTKESCTVNDIELELDTPDAIQIQKNDQIQSDNEGKTNKKQSKEKEKSVTTTQDNIVVPNASRSTETTKPSNEDSRSDDDVPEWAKSPELTAILERQGKMDPERIFGSIAPLQINDVFSKRARK